MHDKKNQQQTLSQSEIIVRTSDTYFGNGEAISDFKILIKYNYTQALSFGLLKTVMIDSLVYNLVFQLLAQL